MAGFYKRQRNRSFERGQARHQRGRRRAQHDQHARGTHESGNGAPRNLEPSRRASGDPREQQQRRGNPGHHVIDEAVRRHCGCRLRAERSGAQGRLSGRQRKVGDPEHIAAAESAGYEAGETDRLSKEERLREAGRGHGASGGAKTGDECREREQPIEPANERKLQRANEREARARKARYA